MSFPRKKFRGAQLLMKRFAVNMVVERTAQRMSQKTMAKALGVSQAMISMMESGTYDITFGRLEDIAAVLGIADPLLLLRETGGEL